MFDWKMYKYRYTHPVNSHAFKSNILILRFFNLNLKMQSLPTDVKHIIFDLLTPKERVMLGATAKFNNSILKHYPGSAGFDKFWETLENIFKIFERCSNSNLQLHFCFTCNLKVNTRLICDDLLKFPPNHANGKERMLDFEIIKNRNERNVNIDVYNTDPIVNEYRIIQSQTLQNISIVRDEVMADVVDEPIFPTFSSFPDIPNARDCMERVFMDMKDGEIFDLCFSSSNLLENPPTIETIARLCCNLLELAKCKRIKSPDLFPYTDDSDYDTDDERNITEAGEYERIFHGLWK